MKPVCHDWQRIGNVALLGCHAGFFDIIKGVAAETVDVVGLAANSAMSIVTNQSILSGQASTGGVETPLGEQEDSAERRMALEQRNARKRNAEQARLARMDKNQVRREKNPYSRGWVPGKRDSSW